MQHFARIQDDLVVEIIVLPDTVTQPAPDFVAPPGDDGTFPEAPMIEMPLTVAMAMHPDFVAQCVPCGAEVMQGWHYDGHAFTAPSPPSALPPEVVLADLKREAGAIISAVVSTTSQLNLNAAMNVIGAKANSARSAEERAFGETFAEGHAWIQAVRARIPALLAAGGETPAGEPRWPEPSQAVRDLASEY